MAEQLICNQQVDGSTPFTSSKYLGGFPSGQRGQTVNLLRFASVVRIHPLPPNKKDLLRQVFFCLVDWSVPLREHEAAFGYEDAYANEVCLRHDKERFAS